MKLLLHVCCGPCALYPVSVIRDCGFEVSLYFYNPNIHPFREFKKRITALSIVSKHLGVKTEIDKTYGLKNFLRKIVFHEEHRCEICYEIRLSQTVEFAKKHGYDSFSTTLLYSRYQNHQLLIDNCTHMANVFSLDFFYSDFREGWQWGILESKKLDLYRQSYCGCIYSEQESFDRKYRRNLLRQ
jgi:epoxyqueuosine reductase